MVAANTPASHACITRLHHTPASHASITRLHHTLRNNFANRPNAPNKLPRQVAALVDGDALEQAPHVGAVGRAHHVYRVHGHVGRERHERLCDHCRHFTQAVLEEGVEERVGRGKQRACPVPCGALRSVSVAAAYHSGRVGGLDVLLVIQVAVVKSVRGAGGASRERRESGKRSGKKKEPSTRKKALHRPFPIQPENALVGKGRRPVVRQHDTAKVVLHRLVAHLVQEPAQRCCEAGALDMRKGAKDGAVGAPWNKRKAQRAAEGGSPGGTVWPVSSERPTSLRLRLAMEACSVETMVAASDELWRKGGSEALGESEAGSTTRGREHLTRPGAQNEAERTKRGRAHKTRPKADSTETPCRDEGPRRKTFLCFGLTCQGCSCAGRYLRPSAAGSAPGST